METLTTTLEIAVAITMPIALLAALAYGITRLFFVLRDHRRLVAFQNYVTVRRQVQELSGGNPTARDLARIKAAADRVEKVTGIPSQTS